MRQTGPRARSIPGVPRFHRGTFCIHSPIEADSENAVALKKMFRDGGPSSVRRSWATPHLMTFGCFWEFGQIGFLGHVGAFWGGFTGVFGICWRFEKFRKMPAHPVFILFPRGESEKIKRVADGTRTRNSQYHKLELYH